jgi:SAM-dependent methyltransferase
MQVIKSLLQLKSCPICFSDKVHLLGYFNYTKPTYFSSNEISLDEKIRLCKCKSCSSSFIGNPVSESLAIELYSNGVSHERWIDYEFQSLYSRKVINLLSSKFERNARLLDIGCGSGSLLDFAKFQGLETYGVEYSKYSHEFLQQKGHTSFNNLNTIQVQFDIITAFDLVEHLYNVPEFLKQCYDLLSANGLLIIFSGDCQSLTAKFTKDKWWYVGFPEHIVFPSKSYFKTLLDFEVLDWISVSHPQNPLKFSFSTWKSSTINIIRRTYRGIPCIYPDHFLAILKKSNLHTI